ncbi:MAG: hypothetical protein R6X19_00370 [Kiritimatiellia bacterium]
MKSTTWIMFLGAVLLVAGMSSSLRADSPHRLGAGANYWVVLENLDDEDIRDLDEEGFSYFASYQYWPTLLGLELQVEMMPDWIGQDDAYAPQAYLLLGGTLYVGAGAGILYFDEEWADEPFYALKAGLNLELLPSLFLDIAANYRFNNKTQFEDNDSDIDSDTVFLGAALRLAW